MAQPLTERTAIVHDWFQGFHGAERVVEAMRAGLFADGNEPDVFTFQAARELLPAELAARIRQESRLANLPGIRQRGHDPGRWRMLLPLMPGYFRRLDLDAYDTVVASSHACAIHARPREGALHVCYCYTPIRYAWLPETEARRARGPAALGLRAARGWLRRKDLEASRRPDGYIAISEAVRERIRTAYGRDAAVVHPPVDVDDFDPHAEKEPGHFLWAHRLVAYKQPQVVAEAFRGLPHRLTMVGVGPLADELRRDLPPNVELRGWVSREELARLYERASGFIHVGEEDFGITMVEALAAGAPVVALARGGALDIVRPDEDGVLVERADPASVREAVERIAARDWDRDALAARAAEFSRERFLSRMLETIEGFRL
ncbi:MAG TPA: glycosyltransferase [Gaiellaceae bacterium]|nr:glycosyltransferase [Gaiellaceae bacterium]